MRKVLIIIILLTTIQACKIGKNYEGTELIQPTNYSRSDTSIAYQTDTINTDSLELKYADIKWWEIYQDEILDSLIKVAMQNNRSALIAAENVLQARYFLGIQKANFLPKVDAGGSISRGNFLLNNIGEANTLIQGQASVYWELDLWGKIRRQTEAARAELMASEYGYRGIMISLISDVASTYFSLLEAHSQLEISKRNANSRDSMLLIIQARFDEGIVPIIDVNQATIQYTIAAGRVPQYIRRVVQLENALSVLVGMNPHEISIGKKLEEQALTIEIPTATPLDLLSRRPDIIAAENILIAENAKVGVAQANRLPTISASGLLGVYGNDFGDIDFSNPLWNLGAQVLGPIFYWGQLKRQVDIQKSKSYQSLYQYENTVFKAIQEVEDVLVEIKTTKQELEIAEQRKAAAIQAQDLSRERYDKGVTSYLEFLEQQRQALDAELLLAGIRARLLSSYIRLYKALGGGWLNESETQMSN